MLDKVENLLMTYAILFVIFLLFVISAVALVGPLILGLLISPYCFLIYVFSLLLSPLMVAAWMLLPSMIKISKEDNE